MNPKESQYEDSTEMNRKSIGREAATVNRSRRHKVLGWLLAATLGLLGTGRALAQKQDVVLWTLGPIYQAVFNEIKPLFDEAYPHVNLVVEGGMGAVDRLVTAYAGGAAPDIVTQSTRNAPQFIEAGMFHPVDYRLFGASDIHSFARRFFPGVVNSLAYKGEIYFLPTEVSSGGLFYNKDILDRAGVAEIPPTWQELSTLGSKLTRMESDTYTQVGVALQRSAVWTTLYWVTLLRQNGVDWVTQDGGPNFTHPRAVDAVRAYHDFFLSGASHPSQAAPAFREGRAAFLPDATYQSFFLVSNPPSWTPGASAYPVLAGGTPNIFSYAWGFYVTRQAKDPSLAWEVVRFLTSPELAPVWARVGGLIIPYQDAWLLELMEEQPTLRPFITGLEHAQMELVHPRGNQIHAAMWEADNAVVQGRLSVEAALQQLNDAVAAILAE